MNEVDFKPLKQGHEHGPQHQHGGDNVHETSHDEERDIHQQQKHETAVDVSNEEIRHSLRNLVHAEVVGKHRGIRNEEQEHRRRQHRLPENGHQVFHANAPVDEEI